MRNECLLFGFLCLFGCSGDDEEKQLRTREEFCREWAAQACSAETVSRCQATSAEACRATQQGFCMNLVPGTFSDERGDACLSAVGSAYADGDLTSGELRTVLRLGPPCDQLTRGPKQRGESCSDAAECNTAGGFECIKKGGSALGVCETPEVVGAGLECEAAQQICMPGFYCNGNNCIASKDPGDPCSNQEECGEDNYCSEALECVARSPVNTACKSDFECRSNVCYTFAADDTICIDRLVLARSEPVCAQLR